MFIVILNNLRRVHENIIFIGDQSETDMPHMRPICLIGDPSDTDMPVETNRGPTCLRSLDV